MNFLDYSYIKTNWLNFLINESQKEYFIKLDNFLKVESQNKVIFPNKEQIFRCFNFFDIENTRVVIFGQDPYFNPKQANGLAFSVDEDVNQKPPSLKNIFKELESDLKINRNNSDLSDWAEQGVLLLNTCLTVVHKNPNSHHNIGWEKFVTNVIEILNIKTNGIIFVLLGNNALKLKKFIDHKKHHILSTSHPSPLSYNKGFKNSKIFSRINGFLIDKIKW